MLISVNFFKAHPYAKIPTRATSESTGFDLYSNMEWLLAKHETRVIVCGVGIEVETVGEFDVDVQIRGRSSLAMQGISAHVGTIDQDYRGEIGVILTNTSKKEYQISHGDRIGQLIFVPRFRDVIVRTVEPTEVRPTTRNSGGFGSTGK